MTERMRMTKEREAEIRSGEVWGPAAARGAIHDVLRELDAVRAERDAYKRAKEEKAVDALAAASSKPKERPPSKTSAADDAGPFGAADRRRHALGEDSDGPPARFWYHDAEGRRCTAFAMSGDGWRQVAITLRGEIAALHEALAGAGEPDDGWFRPQYSGERSTRFWTYIGTEPAPRHDVLYAAGVLLQDMEEKILHWMNNNVRPPSEPRR